MATRSITTICNIEGPVAQFYKHWDGGPPEWGFKLHAFLEGFVIQGSRDGDFSVKSANGAGCLAAQIIAEFKVEPGDIYLQPIGAGREAYNYTVTAIPGRPIRMTIDDRQGHPNSHFDGLLSDFPGWLARYMAPDVPVEPPAKPLDESFWLQGG